MIGRQVSDAAFQHRERFLAAEPFPHVAIDGFFAPEFAEALLRDFPAFDPALARNEIYEGIWGKAVNTEIRRISPTYERLYALIGSDEFLALMSEITGIPGLLLDPKLYGGGTHENLHGQSLDTHVDFNYDEAQKLHRRLNVIVYLNKNWQAEWGGALEVHSNPRRLPENRVKSYNCEFNRAVIFETSERSWHGFPEISLPDNERHRSRKSISIYLYTKERPAEEIAPVHGTFYVHRPLPARFAAGYTLTEDDVKLLNFDVDRRDRWIETYQQMELTKSGDVAQKDAFIAQMLRQVRAPITGYALQTGESTGLYADGWASREVQLRIRPQRPVTQLVVRGWRPDSESIAVDVKGQTPVTTMTGSEVFEIAVPFAFPSLAEYELTIRCDKEFRVPGDSRELAYLLIELQHHH